MPSALMSSPTSSLVSRTAASRGDSPGSTLPPGKLQRPRCGDSALRTTSTLPFLWTTAPAPRTMRANHQRESRARFKTCHGARESLVRVEMLAVGKELLIGRTMDSNAYWMGKRLALMGCMIKEITTVDDELDEIGAALLAALGRTPDFLITVGGLGPTPDDM